MDALVIGCGVIGLSTAIRLQEAGLGVEICTADPPEESTSIVAAATWYPYRAYPEDKVLGWGSQTYKVFEDLSDDPQSGVRMREGIEISRDTLSDPWWGNAVRWIRRCSRDDLPPGYHDGYIFSQPVIEMPIYLRYLLEQFTAAGGRVERAVVSSLEEAARTSHLVVNCTGLGARELVGDHQMTPIRGQIVRVRNPGLDRCVLDENNPDGLTYIVPRSNDCVLGGTAEEGEWDTEPNSEVATEILRRCAALEARLSGVQVLEHKVGLRPGRPTIRLELELLPGDGLCIHNYGHGGAGVTLSWGCAEEVLELIRQTRSL